MNTSKQNAPQIYDRQYNLMYAFVYGSKLQGAFGSAIELEYRNARNILVYDIPKKIKTALFAPGELESEYVDGILYEQYFDSAKKMLVLGGHYMDKVSNNYNLFEREVKGQLLVLTRHMSRPERSLWISDKWGFEKERVATFSTKASWHLDLFNDQIRILEYDVEDLNLTNINW